MKPLNKPAALAITIICLTVLGLAAALPGKATSDAPQMQWEKTYGKSHSVIEAAAKTSDGGFIIAGGDNSSIISDFDYYNGYTPYVVKTDRNGNIIWEQHYPKNTFGGINNELSMSSIEETGNGNYLVSCADRVVQLDSKGTFVDSRNIGSGFSNYVLTPDQGYVSMKNYNETSYCVLKKVDGAGLVSWTRTFIEANTNVLSSGVWGNSVIATSDGGYAVAGNWENDAWLLKLDHDGNVVLNQTYRFSFSSGQLSGGPLIEPKGGGFLISGIGNKPWVAKTDSAGIVEWAHEFSARGPINSIAETADGGYIGGGANFGAWLFKLDSLGNLLWNVTYTGPSDTDNVVRTALETADGGYAAIGNLDDSIWLAKFAPEVSPTPTPALTPSPSPSLNPTQTAAPTSSSNPSASVPEFPTWITLPLIAATLLAVFLAKKRSCNQIQ
jgi:hypothetical protein